MTYSSTIYFVESLNEKGERKIVVHTAGTKYYKFADGKKATKFRDELKAANPHKKYRRCKQTESTNEGDWI